MKAVRERKTEKTGYSITSSSTVEGTKYVPSFKITVDLTTSDLRAVARLVKDLEKHLERIEDGK